MLEQMSDFFEARLDGYDAHMMQNIDGAAAFYPFTADQLPAHPHCCLLDLGCGTGLELEFYFRRNPSAHVTGIDLSQGMLSALQHKFPDKALTLICGSYFDTPLGTAAFDCAVSVESLHHFTKDEKIALYTNLHHALRDNGYFILTDYFSLSDEEELQHRQTYLSLLQQQGLSADAFYHYDTPLTVAHEVEALHSAGFRSVTVLKNWGATYTIKAVR